MARIPGLTNTLHTNGHTMKEEQRRPRLDLDAIWNLAYKEVAKKKSLKHSNRGDKTTVRYSHHPSLQKTAANVVNSNP